MFGPTLALLTRSLRLDARQVRSHLIRLSFVGLIYLCMFWAQIMSAMYGAPGLEFFKLICFLNCVFITAAGISYFAGAITEEKEEETLELLKMAGVSRIALLLGKSTSRLLGAALLLILQFPFILLAITLGGVTLAQIIAATLALLAYMILLANLGLFCSVFCRNTSRAAGLTFLLLIAYLGGVPLAAAVVADMVQSGYILAGDPAVQGAQDVLERLSASSIFRRIWEITQTGFAESPLSSQVVGHVVSAGVLFLLSWATFDLFTRESGRENPDRMSPFTPTGRWKQLGAGRAWANPLAWKDFHFMAGGWFYLAAKSVLYGILLAALLIVVSTGEPYVSWENLGGWTMGTMAVVAALELCHFSSRVFNDELKWKTLPVLALLPISPARLMVSKVAGGVIGLVPAAGYFLLGAAVWPEGFGQAALSPITWYGVMMFLIFLHLTAYLSLFVKWGAFALSFVIMFVFAYCCPVFTMLFLLVSVGQGSILACVPIILVGFMLVVPFQFAITARLQSLAAQ